METIPDRLRRIRTSPQIDIVGMRSTDPVVDDRDLLRHEKWGPPAATVHRSIRQVELCVSVCEDDSAFVVQQIQDVVPAITRSAAIVERGVDHPRRCEAVRKTAQAVAGDRRWARGKSRRTTENCHSRRENQTPQGTTLHGKVGTTVWAPGLVLFSIRRRRRAAVCPSA